MSIDDDCCEDGCGKDGCGKDGCVKDGCCEDEGCKECCVAQNKELTVSSKMVIIFRILGGIMLCFTFIDFGISAAIGASGFVALGWTEFCLSLISIIAGIFALIPYNRNFVIVLFSFSLGSSVATFIAIFYIGMFVESCRAFLQEFDDFDVTYENDHGTYLFYSNASCSLIDVDFSFVLLRFFIVVPLTVFSGIKLFGKGLISEEEGPRAVTTNPVINNAVGK